MTKSHFSGFTNWEENGFTDSIPDSILLFDLFVLGNRNAAKLKVRVFKVLLFVDKNSQSNTPGNLNQFSRIREWTLRQHGADPVRPSQLVWCERGFRSPFKEMHAHVLIAFTCRFPDHRTFDGLDGLRCVKINLVSANQDFVCKIARRISFQFDNDLWPIYRDCRAGIICF